MLSTLDFSFISEGTGSNISLNDARKEVEVALDPKETIENPTSRFKKLSERDFSQIEEARQSKATENNTKWGIKMFQDWSLESNGTKIEFQHVSKQQLNEYLRRFYAEATPKHVGQRREKMGQNSASEYHRNTLINVLAAINRHLSDLKLDVDIVRDRDFKLANQMLDAKLKFNVESGLSRAVKHKAIISEGDLLKINSYLAPKNPVLLRYKVWFDLAINFVSRGLEFHQQLTINSFKFCVDENDREYVTVVHETKQKNRQGGLKNDKAPVDQRMYSTGQENCPVQLLKRFIQKTSPNATALFNHCCKDALKNPSAEEIWFSDQPVKPYQFTKFMGDISKNAKCSQIYTAHCLRATSIQAMSDSGHELCHIMFFTGHKNESSIRSYSRNCTSAQKASISNTLSCISGCKTEDSFVNHHNEVVLHHSKCNPKSAKSLHPSFALGAPLHTKNAENNEAAPNINTLTRQSFLSSGLLSHSSLANCTFNFGP